MRRLKKLSIIAWLARFGCIFAGRYGIDGTAESRKRQRFQAPAYVAKVLGALAQQAQLMSVWMRADRTYGQLEPLAKTAETTHHSATPERGSTGTSARHGQSRPSRTRSDQRQPVLG